LNINVFIFAALQSRLSGVMFRLGGFSGDHGSVAGQAAPFYVQLPVDGFLAFLGLALHSLSKWVLVKS
jgi:hypothetical protein